MADFSEIPDTPQDDLASRPLFAQWLFVTTFAWGLVGAANQAWDPGPDEIIVICAGWILSGFLQSAVLRQHVNWSGEWILPSLGAAPVAVLILALGLGSAEVGQASPCSEPPSPSRNG